MTRIVIFLVLFYAALSNTSISAEQPKWTFTEEQLRLFNPPVESDAEAMLNWCHTLESPIPSDTKPYGGFDKYREHVHLMQLMISRAILDTNPPLEMEAKARYTRWFPYRLLCEQNKEEWIPKMQAEYEELKALSQKKGDVWDEQAALYLSCRMIFVRNLLKQDPSLFERGKELLQEIDHLLERPRQFDERESGIVGIKSELLSVLGTVDNTYEQKRKDYLAEQKKMFLQIEDQVKTVRFFYLLYPEFPLDTPEKQAEAYRLIEKFQKLIDTNDQTKRFADKDLRTLYNHQMIMFDSLIRADADYIPKWRIYLDALEKKNDPPLHEHLYSGYRELWNVKLHAFSKDGGSDEELIQIFNDMLKMLDYAEDHYDNAGSWVANIQYYSPDPVTKCTPPQRKIYLDRLDQVIAKMEIIEKAYKESGQRLQEETYVEPLRLYSHFHRMPGTVVELSGKTVDGTPFDIKQYRGKVVVLHFWATWCGPCLKQIPLLQELHGKYHDQGLEVLGISYDFEPEKIREFLEKRKLPWLSLYDEGRKLLDRFAPGNAPYECIIDRDGKVIFYETDEELKAKLKELFEGR